MASDEEAAAVELAALNGSGVGAHEGMVAVVVAESQPAANGEKSDGASKDGKAPRMRTPGTADAPAAKFQPVGRYCLQAKVVYFLLCIVCSFVYFFIAQFLIMCSSRSCFQNNRTRLADIEVAFVDPTTQSFRKLPRSVRRFYGGQNGEIEGIRELHKTLAGEGESAEDYMRRVRSVERHTSYVSSAVNVLLLVALVLAVVFSGTFIFEFSPFALSVSLSCWPPLRDVPLIPSSPHHRIGALSIIASLMDSGLDFLSGLLMLAAAHLKRRVNIYHYPQGRERVEPVTVLMFSAVMGTASLLLIMQSVERLITNPFTPVDIGRSMEGKSHYACSHFFPSSRLGVYWHRSGRRGRQAGALGVLLFLSPRIVHPRGPRSGSPQRRVRQLVCIGLCTARSLYLGAHRSDGLDSHLFLDHLQLVGHVSRYGFS